MSEAKEGSPSQLKLQKDIEGAGSLRKHSFNINPFRLFLSKEQRQRKQFAQLRKDVHREMALQHIKRIRTNPTPTTEEIAIGVLSEELEPQVRSTVFELNQKGYKTVSSGFEGDKGAEYKPEYQVIEGNFILDYETKARLENMGIEITTEPYWKWQMAERMGITTPRAAEEDKILTTIRFRPPNPNLQEIEVKWKQIAAALPNKR